MIWTHNTQRTKKRIGNHQNQYTICVVKLLVESVCLYRFLSQRKINIYHFTYQTYLNNNKNHKIKFNRLIKFIVWTCLTSYQSYSINTSDLTNKALHQHLVIKLFLLIRGVSIPQISDKEILHNKIGKLSKKWLWSCLNWWRNIGVPIYKP